MPDLGSFHIDAGGAVRPIPGNSNHGGACYDGNGQALYIVSVNGVFQVWRTRAGWKTLLQVDSSVDYLSTVTTDTFNESPRTTAAIQRIGGTLYATISGKKPDTLKIGHWIYRDTSAAQDGSGPWVLHGTVNVFTFPGGGSINNHLYCLPMAGEIMVLPSGQWVQNAAAFDGNASYTTGSGALYVSNDAGATWAQRFNSGSESWGRNFAQFGGSWYFGGAQYWKSSDLTAFTALGDLRDGTSQASYAISTPGVIYRVERTSGTVTAFLQVASTAPETYPAWVNACQVPFDTDGQLALICNISSSNRPTWAATVAGLITRVSSASTQAPPCRLYPREDGLGTSSATRQFPRPRGQQTGYRQTDYY